MLSPQLQGYLDLIGRIANAVVHPNLARNPARALPTSRGAHNLVNGQPLTVQQTTTLI